MQSASDARNQHIADQENITLNTVKKWRSRWLDAVAYLAEIEAQDTAKELEAAVKHILSDQPRSGAPVKFTAEQVCQMIAIACEPPEDSGASSHGMDTQRVG